VARSIMWDDRPVTQSIAIPDPAAPNSRATCTSHGAMDFSWDGQATQITPRGNRRSVPAPPTGCH